jgi:uncharacterized integral membrane protein
VPRTRAGAAWVALIAVALLAVLLIVFLVQNTHSIEISFLWMTTSTPLAVALLVAAVGSVVLTLIVGTARITQLRRLVRKNRRLLGRIATITMSGQQSRCEIYTDDSQKLGAESTDHIRNGVESKLSRTSRTGGQAPSSSMIDPDRPYVTAGIPIMMIAARRNSVDSVDDLLAPILGVRTQSATAVQGGLSNREHHQTNRNTDDHR